MKFLYDKVSLNWLQQSKEAHSKGYSSVMVAGSGRRNGRFWQGSIRSAPHIPICYDCIASVFWSAERVLVGVMYTLSERGRRRIRWLERWS